MEATELKRLQSDLDNLIGISPPTRMEQIRIYRECLNSLIDRQRMRAVLKDIVENRSVELQNIAKRSYGHLNGFDKIVLISSPQPKYRLRLHIWWPQSDTGVVERIHNHAWDFGSMLLTGAYRFQEYIVSDQYSRDAVCFQQYCCRPSSKIHDARSYEMVRVGEKPLLCCFDSTLVAGSSYTLSSETLHRVISHPRTLTSTVVLVGPFLKNYSDVYAEDAFPDQDVVSPDSFRPDELCKKLINYMETLA